MKLLRDTLLLRALRRLLAGRREAVRRSYAITVPAPLAKPGGNNVIELHRRSLAPVSHHAMAHGRCTAIVRTSCTGIQSLMVVLTSCKGWPPPVGCRCGRMRGQTR